MKAKTIIAMGDAKFSSSMRGHASTPVAFMRKRLRQYATVINVDEFYTSKLCSSCFHELTPFKNYRCKKKPKMSSVQNYLRSCGYHLCAKPTKPRSQRLLPVHGVRVCNCKQNDCALRRWNRDENSARNMILLAEYAILHNGHRLPPFSRSKAIRKQDMPKAHPLFCQTTGSTDRRPS